MSVCPVWQHGQSFSVFTFSTRGVVDLAEAFLLVRDFQNAFRRGSSSSSSTSTNKISIYEDSLFKRGGFPCLRSLASEHPTTLFPPLQLPTADYGGTQIPQACLSNTCSSKSAGISNSSPESTAVLIRSILKGTILSLKSLSAMA